MDLEVNWSKKVMRLEFNSNDIVQFQHFLKSGIQVVNELNCENCQLKLKFIQNIFLLFLILPL